MAERGNSNSRHSRVHLRSNVSLWAYEPVSISATSHKAERVQSRLEKPLPRELTGRTRYRAWGIV
jgi:hypothetical protein